MRACPKCKNSYPDDTEFCPRDGTALPRAGEVSAAELESGLGRRFRIVRRLGAGGMGTVYLAEQIAVGNRPVALKVLLRKLLDDPAFLLRFQNEAASTGRIRHSNVVTIYESGQSDEGSPYIAMEYLEGETLRQVLERRGALPLAECAEILQQAARGLNSAHKLGILHRDLKPDNIFLTRSEDGDQVVKVVDFGLAKMRESAAHTLTGTVLGTPIYMSPEQCLGMKSDELDARSDIYSLGVIVYELLAGRVPFRSETPIGYLHKHVSEAPPPLRSAAPGLAVPSEVEKVLMKALAKAREQRHGSVIEFSREFGAAASSAIGAPTPAPVPTTSSVTRVLDNLEPSPEPGTVRVNPIDGLKYVWIPPGTFMMGCSPGDREAYFQENPPHQVTITKGFWMGQTPVTVAAYQRFVAATGRQMPVTPVFNTNWANRKMPIVNVTWEEAQAYCEWAGGRLPTEGEWEYAARAGDTEACYGPIDEIAWYANNCGRERLDSAAMITTDEPNYFTRLIENGNGTKDVGQKSPNEFRLYDTIGNVYEWASDWYDENYYLDSPSQDPPGPATGQQRVQRGGAWYETSRGARVSYRYGQDPQQRAPGNGLRCVLKTAPPEPGLELSRQTSESAPHMVEENPKDRLKYVWIPPGTFVMGCMPGNGPGDEAKPPHFVTHTKGFWMGQTPVTVAAYRRFAAATRRQMPAAPMYNPGWANPNLPMVHVTWAEAREYCEWAGGRLPTEAEWEYAARAGSTEAHYGPLEEIAWYADNCGRTRLDSAKILSEGVANFVQRIVDNGGGAHEVGGKRANALGLCDMLGNVWEWVNDWFDPNYYRNSPSQDPTGPASGENRVLRGGSWCDPPQHFHVSLRHNSDPKQRILTNGFRCVWEKPAPAHPPAPRFAVPRQASALAPGTVREHPEDGLKYVWIPPGTYMMGCSPGDTTGVETEKPSHPVTITKGFWMSQTQVTVAAYERFALETARSMPPAPTYNPGWTNKTLPMVCATWEEALAYCQWAGGRLPTEAEWEYAARAGTTEYFYGTLDEIAWHVDNSGRERLDGTKIWNEDRENYNKRVTENGNSTHEVGQKRPNSFGLYDIIGNVLEWVNDFFGENYYQNSDPQDPPGPASGDKRVLRGGAYDFVPWYQRVSSRFVAAPESRYLNLGIRCIWEPDWPAPESRSEPPEPAAAPAPAPPAQPPATPVETPKQESAWAPQPVKENLKDRLKYIWVPPGTFQMGASPGDSEAFDMEKPAHQVTLTKGFWIGQTPVTVAAYQLFAAATGRSMPKAPDFNYPWCYPNMPIVSVTWDEAQAYCQWAGGRLPTEAEWEYAARAGSTEARYGPLDDIAWYADNSGRERLDSTRMMQEDNANADRRMRANGCCTHEVARKLPNAFGLYDTLGNVSEWVNDWLAQNYYQHSPSVDPIGPSAGYSRVVRGACWYYKPGWIRVSFRAGTHPDTRVELYGLRCVWETDPP